MIEEWMLADYRGAEEFLGCQKRQFARLTTMSIEAGFTQAVHEHGTKHMKQRLVRDNGNLGRVRRCLPRVC